MGEIMKEDSNNSMLIVNNVDEAVLSTIDLLLKYGKKVPETKLTNNHDSSIELENMQFTITNPLDRIAVNKINPLNLIAAIGRLTWTFAGNDRTEDIAFYQSRVRDYSDNSLTVAGSDYGKRIFDPLAGVDQLENVINLLKKDKFSRRAVIPIFSPTDSTRLDSKDLPCAFGLTFLVREDELHSTLIMRSNNGLLLLPTNIFEFTIISEIVARELDIEYAQHVHTSISMHIFEKDLSKIPEYKKLSSNVEEAHVLMPKMPSKPSPMLQAKKLAQLEASLRNDNVLLDVSHVYEPLQKAKIDLSPYWFEFFKVLCIGALLHAKEYTRAKDLAEELPDYFRKPIISYFDVMMPKVDNTLDPFITTNKMSKFESIRNALQPDFEEAKAIIPILNDFTNQFENEKGIVITREQYAKLVQKYLTRGVAAARSTAKDNENVEDLRKISKREIFDDLKGIISEK